MAQNQLDTGQGASVVFGTSGESFNITTIGLPEETREPISTVHLGSTKMTVIAGDLADHSVMTLEGHFDAQAALPVTDTAAQTVTVSFPLISGGSSAATYAGSAMITKVGAPQLVTGELQAITLEVKFDEVTGPTFTPAT
jgi:hypothetical protein